MAVDMFLKIDGVAGESSDAKHKGEIDILAWSWGMTQSGSMHVGTGGGSGKVSVQDIHITKRVDKATPVLLNYCCTGKHFKEVTLSVNKAGGDKLEYLKMEMKDVLISSYSTGGSPHDDAVHESLSLNFAQYKVIYTPQKADGTADATVEQSYDIRENKAR